MATNKLGHRALDELKMNKNMLDRKITELEMLLGYEGKIMKVELQSGDTMSSRYIRVSKIECDGDSLDEFYVVGTSIEITRSGSVYCTDIYRCKLSDKTLSMRSEGDFRREVQMAINNIVNKFNAL